MKTKKPAFYLIAVFILIRLALNLFPPITTLSMIFIISYLILGTLLMKKFKFFIHLFILFLYLDSIIGTYLFTSANNLGAEFYGTMIINAAFIILAFLYKGGK